MTSILAPSNRFRPIPKPTTGQPLTPTPAQPRAATSRPNEPPSGVPPTLGTPNTPTATPPAPAVPTAPNTQTQREAFKGLVTKAGGFEQADWNDIDKLGGQGYSRDAVARTIRGAGGYDSANWDDIDKAFGWATPAPAPKTPTNTAPPIDRNPTFGAPPVPTAKPTTAVPLPTDAAPPRPATAKPVPSAPIDPPGRTLPITPITPETSPVGENLRGNIYAPGDDPRLKGAQQATDWAGGIVQGTHRQPVQSQMEDRYRSVFGTGGVDPRQFTVDPDVQFRRMATDVNAPSLNPNVEYQGVNTQVNKGPAVDPMESARTARYGAAQDQALEGLNGPNRTELAKQALADFQAEGERGLQQRFRQVGQTAAKLGRIGMGDVNAELGSIQGDYERDRLAKQNELARSVAEGDISDRFRRVDATSGLRALESDIDTGMRGERRVERDYGTGLDERNVGRAVNERDSLVGARERNMARATDERNFRAGLDTANLERGMGERDLETALAERNTGRRMGERDTQLGIAEGNQSRLFDRQRAAIDTATGQTDRNVNDVYDRFSAAGSLEDRIFGQGRSNRDEFRGERGYQNEQAQQTIENRIREMEVQNALEDMRLRRAMMQAQAGGI